MLSKVIRRLLNFQHNKKRLFQKETAVKFVKKPNLLFCGDKPHFCFSADMCGRKTPILAKTALSAVFKSAWVVLAGVECSPKIIRFSANGISAKRVSILSTLFFYRFGLKLGISCNLNRFALCLRSINAFFSRSSITPSRI